MTKVRAFLRATAGTTSIEYAIMAAFLSIAIVAGATALGTNLNARFTTISTGFT